MSAPIEGRPAVPLGCNRDIFASDNFVDRYVGHWRKRVIARMAFTAYRGYGYGYRHGTGPSSPTGGEGG